MNSEQVKTILDKITQECYDYINTRVREKLQFDITKEECPELYGNNVEEVFDFDWYNIDYYQQSLVVDGSVIRMIVNAVYEIKDNILYIDEAYEGENSISNIYIDVNKISAIYREYIDNGEFNKK